MRIKALLTGDIRFQFKYGFYWVYLIFTVIYVGLLYALPPAWRKTGMDIRKVLLYYDKISIISLFIFSEIPALAWSMVPRLGSIPEGINGKK